MKNLSWKFTAVLGLLAAVTVVKGAHDGWAVEAIASLVAVEALIITLIHVRRCEACGSWLTFSVRYGPSHDSHLGGWHFGHIYTCLRCKHETVHRMFSREYPSRLF